jgi:hypothetical protein
VNINAGNATATLHKFTVNVGSKLENFIFLVETECKMCNFEQNNIYDRFTVQLLCCEKQVGKGVDYRVANSN